MAAIMSSRPLFARWSGKKPRLPTIMPNVIGRDLPLFISLYPRCLPEDYIQCDKCRSHYDGPEDGTLPDWQMAFRRDHGAAEDQVGEFGCTVIPSEGHLPVWQRPI